MDLRDIQNLRALLSDTSKDPRELRKALTASSGFLGYNLEEVAKLMLPLFGAVRARIPTDTPQMGAAAATWRMQLGYAGYDFGAAMGSAYGANGTGVNGQATTISAAYASQSVTGSVQWEAMQQARGWDNAIKIETAIQLSTLIKLDELLNIGGNVAALTAPVPVGNPSTATAINTFVAGTWSVFVVAITEENYQSNLATAADATNGVSARSTRLDIVVPAGDCDFLDISWPAVPGAIGYKIYCNAAVGGGNTAYLVNPALGLRYKTGNLTTFGDLFVVNFTGQTSFGVNHLQIYTVPLNTQPAVPAAATDTSADANQFEGLISWCEKTSMYGTSGLTHQNVDMDGGLLTTYGAGVQEFDQVLENLWSTQVIAPTLCLTSPKGVVSLGNHVIAANNGNMYRLEMANERGKLVGGIFIGGYINKFAASLTQQQSNLEVWAHPYIPDGTFLFMSEQIPYQYSQTGRAFGLDVQTPYTYFELARTTRVIPFDVFFTETGKCYHPNAQAAIVGARVDA